jgi:uncharacterized protein YjcR
MALDKRALQHELDLAAEELDKAGHKDLADRVDQYSEMLVNASEKEIPRIHRGLSRVQAEFEQRAKKSEKIDPKVAKAQNAVMSARRASIKRKIAIKRLLRERAAKRKQETKKVEALKVQPKEESPLKSRLTERIADAEKELKVATHRVDRLRRIQKQMK